MGITHYSILNKLLNNADFTFVEPNKKLTFLLKKNFLVKFFNNDSRLNKKFDLSIITAPPFAHNQIINSCMKRGDNVIFVEKPFGGYLNNKNIFNKNIFVGYVLRFNPIVQWIKKNIDPSEIKYIYASYKSNTIQNKPTGWRNSNHSGVLNEMGSHLIDLTNYLFDITKFNLNNVSINSHITDFDDEVSIQINSKFREFKFYFNWVDKSLRKQVFEYKVITKKGDEISFDQQMISIKNKNSKTRKIFVSDICDTVPYYLRGIDFTKQMQDLIKNQKIICKADDAVFVNNFIYEVINYENNIMR